MDWATFLFCALCAESCVQWVFNAYIFVIHCWKSDDDENDD